MNAIETERETTTITPFTRRVITIIQSIPAGHVMTYGQIAACAGSPRAARQVVRILHSMSKKHRLPWHRVVNSKGEIAVRDDESYHMQQLLLEDEGVAIMNRNQIDLERYQFQPREETSRMNPYQSIIRDAEKPAHAYHQISEQIQQKGSEVGFERLDASEQQFLLIDRLIMELNNGGFDQYFTNRDGELVPETMQALENLHLDFLSDLFKRAKQIAESGRSEDVIMDELDEFDNEFYDEMNYDELYEKLFRLFA